MFNPYAHGNWPNSNNPNASRPSGTVPQPSIFGALPYPTPTGGPAPSWMNFRFSGAGPLNCTVTGPHGGTTRTYFTVRTEKHGNAPGFTVVTDHTNQAVVAIEWGQHAVIEVRNIVSKRPTGQWLALAPGQKARQMSARGKSFIWTPDEDDISLYSVGLGSPQIYARIFRADKEIILQMTTEAIQIGLLEVCVASALLLQCGRNID
ncbi:hypothetical protein MKEN_00268200 [Mycena kentingensis (nom. inval.)]|nr:hypothetical protein MKEN_00268200 [Mycena kentingensis (nom. inval.)]